MASVGASILTLALFTGQIYIHTVGSEIDITSLIIATHSITPRIYLLIDCDVQHSYTYTPPPSVAHPHTHIATYLQVCSLERRC
jgi:hypothetical protein